MGTFGTLYNFPMFFPKIYPKRTIFFLSQTLPPQKPPKEKGHQKRALFSLQFVHIYVFMPS
jgi:hypothetical protein